MHRVLFIFSLLLLSSLPVYAEKIKQIEINGLSAVSRGTVLSYLNFEVGDDFSLEDSNKVISNLFKSNLFNQIKIDFNQNRLEVTVTENPVIKFIDITDEENNLIEPEQIDKLKKDLDFEIGDIYSKQKLKKLSSILKSLYQSEGFFEVNVITNFDQDSKNRIGIDVDIKSGERALITKFKISGNSFFDNDDLVDVFEIGEPDFFLVNFFTEKDRYTKTKLDAGIEALRSLYLKNGFLDFSVKNDVTFQENKIEISLEISEGKPYLTGNLVFQNLPSFISNDLATSFYKFEKNERIKRDKLVSANANFEDYLQNLGYSRAIVTTSLIDTNEKYVLDIGVGIDINQQTYINRINISGNFKTQDEVIRREIKILEGEIFSQNKLKNALNNLKRLGFFSDVKITQSNVLDKPNFVDLFVVVEETKTGEISVGVSHSNESGAAFTAGISQKNFLGTGVELNAKLSNSAAVQDINLYVKDPYFKSNKVALSYGVFSRKTDGSNLSVSSYEIDSSGILFGYGFPLSGDSSFFSELKVSSSDVKCDAVLAAVEAQCNDNFSTDLPLKFSYTKDSTNDYVFPTEGSRTNLAFTLAIPGSDFKYWKSENSFKNYIPLTDKFTFKQSYSINLAGGYGGQELPFFKRYLAGGASSLRGFDFNSIGPKYSDASSTPKGGDISIQGTYALSVPLNFSNVSSGNIRGITFIDYGTISESMSSIKFNEFRASSGLQLNWNSPIGPIGVYYAIPLKKVDGDETQSFSLKLGAFF